MALQRIGTIGQYEISARLGSGGMGTVYRARDPRFDRDVAVKVLHPQLAHDPEIVARFKSEAVIQAKLNHPSIATVFDFVVEGETLAIVMEFIEGETLEQAIAAARGGLPLDRARRIVQQVLSAVGFAHARGLVHRDLKPSNVMLQRFDDDEVVKVMDFGVAKILGSEKARTATSAKIGTLAYMSPEHVQSPKSVSARSDLYSLGVVLVEMLTGRLPFDAETEYGMMRQIIEADPDLSGVSSRLRDVIRCALAKRPEARFATAQEFRRALDLADAPGAAAPDRAAPPQRPVSSAAPAMTTPVPADFAGMIGLQSLEAALDRIRVSYSRKDAVAVAAGLAAGLPLGVAFNQHAVVRGASDWLSREQRESAIDSLRKAYSRGDRSGARTALSLVLAAFGRDADDSPTVRIVRDWVNREPDSGPEAGQ